MRAPRGPAFNEDDVSDKPGWVKNLPRLNADERARLDADHRNRLRSLQAVDEMVEALVNDLDAAGKLQNTYFVFASDNGYLLGEHRINAEKNAPYEESIRVPLLVRGPGVPAGRTTDQMALNIDLAPTFAEIASVSVPGFVDGRSLVPTFASDPTAWRTGFLEEFWGSKGSSVPAHSSVRTSGEKYVEYEDRDKELYDLTDDPHELDNAHAQADPALKTDLRARLEALEDCKGRECRDAEDGP